MPVLVGEKLGQARAYNDVFATLDTPYVVWISDDNEVVDHGLDVAVDILERLPRVGMVGVKVKDVEGPFVEAPYLGAVSSIGVLNVNQGMLRASVLHTVGGFSERFRDYGIDPEPDGEGVVQRLGRRLHAGRRAPALPGLGRRRRGQRSAARATGRLRQAVPARSGAPMRRLTAPGDFDSAWKAIQKATGLRINSSRPLLGLDGRDWCNVLTGRYISPLDPILTRGQPYHLIQRAPALCRALPPDPA